MIDSHLTLPAGATLFQGGMAGQLSALQEIKAEGKELWDHVTHLRELCTRPISICDQCLSFVRLLADLRDELALTFAEEEAYESRWANADSSQALVQQTGALRNEHRSLYLEIARLVERAETLLARRQAATIAILVPADFEAFFAKLQRHEWKERALIYETQELEHEDGD